MDEPRVWVNRDADAGGRLHVRLGVALVRGRVTIVAVHAENAGGVTVEDLREIPIARLEATWNDTSSEAGRRVGGRIRRALDDAQDRAVETLRQAGLHEPALKIPTARELRLTIPADQRYPDEFYRRVATLYYALVANGKRPAPAIAQANEVPVRTVHGWFGEARRRGFLAPGRRGRAG